MRLEGEDTVSCDVLVIGGGGAGLRAAIAAKSDGNRVVLASKSRIGHSTNTYISKAILAASGLGEPDDNADVHTQDTIKGGRLLNDPAIVARITRRAGAEVSFLRTCGVRFGMEKGRPGLLKIPGHQYPRHLYGENWLGSDLVLPLKRHAEQVGVRFLEHLFITRLLSSENRITGATGFTLDGRFVVFQAKTVILATGGYAQVFLNTNNASGITGDGHALAYDLGVALKDMEFVQFYPTAMGKRGSRLLLNEKLLAQPGVALEDEAGQDIFRKNGIEDPLSVTRDELARLMMKEIGYGDVAERRVTMNLETLSQETAGQLSRLLPASWWKGHQKIRVVPTAHFCMGGVVTNDHGETPIDGLFAVGEVAAGAHGANRLGGNALAEIFTMGSLAGETASRREMAPIRPVSIRNQAKAERHRLECLFSDDGIPARQLTRTLKTAMWHKVGIVREQENLTTVLNVLESAWPDALVATPNDLARRLEFENMRQVAEMVTRAAVYRTESRGSHFRSDFPEEDNPNWVKNILLQKGPSGMTCEVKTVGGLNSTSKVFR